MDTAIAALTSAWQASHGEHLCRMRRGSAVLEREEAEMARLRADLEALRAQQVKVRKDLEHMDLVLQYQRDVLQSVGNGARVRRKRGWRVAAPRAGSIPRRRNLKDPPSGGSSPPARGPRSASYDPDKTVSLGSAQEGSGREADGAVAMDGGGDDDNDDVPLLSPPVIVQDAGSVELPPPSQRMQTRELLVGTQPGSGPSDPKPAVPVPAPAPAPNSSRSGKRRRAPGPGRGRDGDPGYAFVEPVRKKADRRQLPGDSCKQCNGFLDAVAGPRVDKDKVRQLCSRHRHRYPKPSTPPGLWDLDV